MKRIALLVFVFVSSLANAQIVQQQPQINVSGEGKVMVMPDQAVVTIGVVNTGADAAEVKKKNDETTAAVVKYLKSIKLPESDYQTQRVNLHRNYDYTKKKYSYVASQTMSITLKDISKYDSMMMGLMDAGINDIQGVEFKTSKLSQYESEARVKAIENARQKANDYAGALGVKVGAPLLVTDNSQPFYPVPMRTMMYKDAMAESAAPEQTLAIGEITITANVNVSYYILLN
jgi:uncharacterized protein